MQFFKDLITNHILIATMSAWFITQLLKIIIHAIVEKEFAKERLFGDGGMPSVHSATVVALATMCGIMEGGGSAIFAVACIFAVVVMRDAMGVRRETAKHALSIKELAEKINGMFDKDKEVRTENIKLLVGHTPLQVFFGALSGACIAVIYYFIFIF